MANHRIKMRLMGTAEDLERWLWFVQKMQERDRSPSATKTATVINANSDAAGARSQFPTSNF